jgi:bacteriocin biosynthesis cyclodehydratase domain-containing protein
MPHPRLRADIALIPMPPDALQLRAGDEEIHVLRGNDAQVLLELLRQLDGSTAPADLRIPGVSPDSITELIAQLNASGLLQTTWPATLMDRYLGHFPNVPSIADAVVDVTGDNEFARVISNVFIEHGIAAVKVGAEYSPREQARAIVCAWEQPHLSQIMAVNAIAARQRIPCLFADLSHGFHATLGPFYIPGEGSCYQCFNSRLLENTAAPEDLAAAQQHMLETQAPHPGFGTTPAHRHWLAGLAAGEVVAFLTGHRALRTLNRAITVDMEALTMHSEPAWRIPWCPACHTPP